MARVTPNRPEVLNAWEARRRAPGRPKPWGAAIFSVTSKGVLVSQSGWPSLRGGGRTRTPVIALFETTEGETSENRKMTPNHPRSGNGMATSSPGWIGQGWAP